MHLPGARANQIAATETSKVVVNGASLLRGWSFQEMTGSASASLEIYDGTNNGGMFVVGITLDDGESTRDYLEGSGIEIRNAIFYVVTSGSVRGSIWASPGEFIDGYVIVRGAIPIP